jgi:hypothetical protein
MNTECTKCIFYNEEHWCDFSIPSVLDTKKYNTDETTHTINDYKCNYAFGKQTFEFIKDETKESISEKIFNRNRLSVSLVVNFDNCNTTTEAICDIIENLAFQPSNILCYGKKISANDITTFKDKSPIPWKLNQIQPDIPDTLALASSVDTTTGKNNTVGFLHINSEESLLDLDNLINGLHISIVINNNVGIFYKTQNNIDGMFMFYDDYKTIGTDKLILIDSPWLFFNLDSYKQTPVHTYI